MEKGTDSGKKKRLSWIARRIEEEREEERKFNECIRRHLREETETLGKELEGDTKLGEVEPSPCAFEKIVQELRREGIWMEEGWEEIFGEANPEAYALLSESDRKALKIGRRVLRRRKYHTVLKGIGVAAVIALFAFTLSMMSEVNRARSCSNGAALTPGIAFSIRQ